MRCSLLRFPRLVADAADGKCARNITRRKDGKHIAVSKTVSLFNISSLRLRIVGKHDGADLRFRHIVRTLRGLPRRARVSEGEARRVRPVARIVKLL